MKTIVMSLWIEILGLLQDVQEFEDHAIAQIGNIAVILPIELGQKLRSLVGVRVAIIHTDVEGKEYLIRVLPEERPNLEMKSVATELNLRQHKPERVP